MIQKRGVAISILNTVISLSLYGLYWYVMIVNEVNKIAKREDRLSGGVSLLLGFVSCSLFTIYTHYRMGEDLDKYFVSQGKAPMNRAAAYMVLPSIITMALIQRDLNIIANELNFLDVDHV